MFNSKKATTTDITKRSKKKLGIAQDFKYLRSIISDEGLKPEFCARTVHTAAALEKLKPVWKAKRITISHKVRLMCTVVLSIFLGTCETWTGTADLQKKIQVVEMRCYRRIFGISFHEYITKEQFCLTITEHIAPYDELVTIAKKCKLKWYGHTT